MKWASLFCGGLLLSGCATTRPLDGADIEYRLPRTDAVATISLTLKSCDSFTVDGTVSITPKAGAREGGYRISAERLASARIKRTLKISRNANDVLVGVNSSVAERSPQIMGNVLKTVATFIPLLASANTQPLKCNEQTRALVNLAQALTDRLKTLRLPHSDGDDVAGAKAAKLSDFDEVSKLLAAVKTALTISFTVPMKIGDAEDDAQKTRPLMAADPFKAWFDGPEDKALANLYAMKWWVVPAPITYVDVDAPIKPRTPTRECGFSMPVPYAIPAVIHVEGVGENVQKNGFDKTASVYVGQWSQRALCLDAGFGETRSNELAFDDFGRETAATWTSEARAETVSGAIAGASGDAMSIITALNPPEVKAQKAEIEELQTLQTLNKLRACEAVIRAGGTTCP